MHGSVRPPHSSSAEPHAPGCLPASTSRNCSMDPLIPGVNSTQPRDPAKTRQVAESDKTSTTAGGLSQRLESTTPRRLLSRSWPFGLLQRLRRALRARGQRGREDLHSGAACAIFPCNPRAMACGRPAPPVTNAVTGRCVPQARARPGETPSITRRRATTYRQLGTRSAS